MEFNRVSMLKMGYDFKLIIEQFIRTKRNSISKFPLIIKSLYLGL